MARQLGVAERTHFLGARHDVADCLRDADVVFCASHYEPSSLVVLEAMASGLPVLTTTGVGNSPFVEDGVNGYVLRSSGDVARTIELLGRLERDARLRIRIGQAARETSLRLSWERMGREYEALYLELLEKRSRETAQNARRFGSRSLLASAEQRA
jgi:glycosyltransferase involved in cell wall biosynthesis